MAQVHLTKKGREKIKRLRLQMEEAKRLQGIEGAALKALEVLIENAGATQVPDPKCPPWAHEAAMILLEALDEINDWRVDVGIQPDPEKETQA